MGLFGNLFGRKDGARSSSPAAEAGSDAAPPLQSTGSAGEHEYKCPYCGTILVGATPGRNISCRGCHSLFSIIDESKLRYTDQYGNSEKHSYKVTIYSGNYEEWGQWELQAGNAREVAAMLDSIKANVGRLDGAAEQIRMGLRRPGGKYVIARKYVEYCGNLIRFCYEEEWKEWVGRGEAAGEF